MTEKQGKRTDRFTLKDLAAQTGISLFKLEKMIIEVTEALADGKSVHIPGVGILKPRELPERVFNGSHLPNSTGGETVKPKRLSVSIEPEEKERLDLFDLLKQTSGLDDAGAEVVLEMIETVVDEGRPLQLTNLGTITKTGGPDRTRKMNVKFNPAGKFREHLDPTFINRDRIPRNRKGDK